MNIDHSAQLETIRRKRVLPLKSKLNSNLTLQVELNIKYNNGNTVTNTIPVDYFNNCEVNGNTLEAGSQVNLDQDSVPQCVSRAMQRYSQDLQNALRNAIQQLQTASDDMNQQSGGLLSLNISALTTTLTNTLSNTLDSTLGEGGLLDTANLLNALQPVTRELSNTVNSVEGTLADIEQELNGLAVDLGRLLGGTVEFLGDNIQGVGSSIQRVGSIVDILGSSVSDTGSSLASGFVGAGQALTAGLVNTGQSLASNLGDTLGDISRLLGGQQQSQSKQ